MRIRNVLTVLARDERGQDLIEYGLLASFISLIAVAVIMSLGTSVNGMYGVIDGQVQAIPGGGS